MEKASIVEKRLRSLRVAAYSLEARIKDLDGQLLATQRAIALTEDELARRGAAGEIGARIDRVRLRHMPKFLEESGDYFPAGCPVERSGFERRVALNGGMPC